MWKWAETVLVILCSRYTAWGLKLIFNGSNIITMKRNKRLDNIILILLLLAGISSCKKYLDVIPDNVATIEHAFKLRNEAEKYLFTLYAYMPKGGDGWYNPAFMGGDEIWLPET